MQTEKASKSARGTVRIENVSMNLLQANDFVAATIREEMRRRNILLINLTSSAGSGKTTLLKETGKRLKGSINMKVLVGDIETDRDATQLRGAGIEAFQIVTGGVCHLEAQMVSQGLKRMDLDGVDLVVVENVGNLVCPASYDLGEDYRVTLLAATEGDDKPKKYPKMFVTSDLMLVSKTDLLPYLPFSVEAASQDARDLNPAIGIMEVSSLQGSGIDVWCDWLAEKVSQKKELVNY